MLYRVLLVCLKDLLTFREVTLITRLVIMPIESQVRMIDGDRVINVNICGRRFCGITINNKALVTPRCHFNPFSRDHNEMASLINRDDSRVYITVIQDIERHVVCRCNNDSTTTSYIFKKVNDSWFKGYRTIEEDSNDSDSDDDNEVHVEKTIYHAFNFDDGVISVEQSDRYITFLSNIQSMSIYQPRQRTWLLGASTINKMRIIEMLCNY